MKKISFLLFFVLCQTAISYAQSAWVTQKIDENLSVKFPEAATYTPKKGIDSYVYKGKDSVQYNAIVMDYKVLANMDSAMLAPMKDNQQFADQMMDGIAAQKPNYTFGEAKIGKWKTYTTYSFAGTDKSNQSKLTIQMILIGHKMYSFSCLIPTQLDTKNADLFLSSPALLK